MQHAVAGKLGIFLRLSKNFIADSDSAVFFFFFFFFVGGGGGVAYNHSLEPQFSYVTATGGSHGSFGRLKFVLRFRLRCLIKKKNYKPYALELSPGTFWVHKNDILLAFKSPLFCPTMIPVSFIIGSTRTLSYNNNNLFTP